MQQVFCSAVGARHARPVTVGGCPFTGNYARLRAGHARPLPCKAGAALPYTRPASPAGGSCQRPRPLTDEGSACGCCPCIGHTRKAPRRAPVGAGHARPAALPLLQLCLLCAGAGFISPGHVSFDADFSFCSVGRGLDPSAELSKNACRGEHCSPVPVCLARKPSRKMRFGGKWAGDQWSPLHTQ